MEILFGRDPLPVVISFFICGAISGIIYDLLEIKRYIIHTNKIILFFDDLLFMLCNAVIIIFNAYAFNNGNIKWYEIPAMIIGFSVYKSTFSKVFLKIAFSVIAIIKKVLIQIIIPIKKALLFLFTFINARVEELYLMCVVFKYKRLMLNIHNLFGS